jgi:hypothetical protein
MAISVTRALAEVKALNDRIEKATRTPAFISVTVGGKIVNGAGDIQTVAAQLKANLQSVTDLIARRNLVKGAIIRSNAVTKVTINGVEMTVAEAIERKGSIDKERALVAVLLQQLGQVKTAVERNNVQMQGKIDAMLLTAIGKERKATEEELEAISKPYTASNVTALLDPNGLEAVTQKMSEDINGFIFEVDYVLSEANAKTELVV